MTTLSGTYNRLSGGAVLPQARQPLFYRLTVELLLLVLLGVLVAGALLAQNRSLGEDAAVKAAFGINASREPLQKPAPYFSTYVDTPDGGARLISDTTYSINARVEGFRAYDDEISSVAPYDLLLAWGDAADPEVAGALSWQQYDRQGTVSGTLKKSGTSEMNAAYIISHVSNNHVIAANDDIRAGLASIRPGDLVRIDGRLVDLKVSSGSQRLEVQSSKSRFDQGDGACEIVYIEHLQVNGRDF